MQTTNPPDELAVDDIVYLFLFMCIYLPSSQGLILQMEDDRAGSQFSGSYELPHSQYAKQHNHCIMIVWSNLSLIDISMHKPNVELNLAFTLAFIMH